MLAEAGKTPPHCKERVLYDVVSIGLAPENRAGGSERAGQPGCDECLECVHVARRGSLDQIGVPDDPSVGPTSHVHTIETTRKGSGLGIAEQADEFGASLQSERA